MTTLPRLGRPTERQDLIVQDLRLLIVKGNLAPGSKLPTRVDLERQYGVSNNTVQRALERLKRDGFVIASGRNGTFVAEAPPHLARYGLVFPHTPQKSSWPLFWTALNQEARGLERDNAITIPFYGVESSPTGAEVQDLWRQVREHRLAGLIIGAPLTAYVDSPLWSEPGIPRVLIGANPAVAGVPHVQLDREAYLQKAMDYLRRRGRTRPAFISISVSEAQTASEDLVWQQAGFETRPYWRQATHISTPNGARRVANLLMQARDTPDALVVADDNLVEEATAGLRDAGVRIPQDLDVLVHCNYPMQSPTCVPAQRLGYHARHIMAACLNSIDLQRQAREVPDEVLIPPFFEEELSEN